MRVKYVSLVSGAPDRESRLLWKNSLQRIHVDQQPDSKEIPGNAFLSPC